MDKKTILTILGFLIFAFGFLAITLSLVGLNFTFLSFLEKPGRTFAFVIKLIMVFGGFIMFYIGRMDNSID